MPHAVTRTDDNIFDKKFHLKFVERLYDGPARWWSKEWEKYYVKPVGAEGYRIDREAGPKKLMALAHDRTKFLSPPVPSLVTCINPVCPVRNWYMLEALWTTPDKYSQRSWTVVNEFAKDFDVPPTAEQTQTANEARVIMSNGQYSDLTVCPNCSFPRVYFGLSAIQSKWVYVLKESGTSLTPHLEIEITDPTSGFIHAQLSKGKFTDKTIPYDGALSADHLDKPGKVQLSTWHFFLSPVRLGAAALTLLSQAPSHDSAHAKKRDKANPDHFHVPFLPVLQPWTTTLKRRFQARQLKTPYEFIPLIDPVAWVAQIDEMDYVPIAAAQQKLIQDRAEQSKLFVASVLAQEIGRIQVSDNPPQFTKETDPWHVKNDTVPPPDQFKSSPSSAHAFVKHYQDTLEYLTTETNNACCRVFFPVQFGFGHRVVEAACQDTDGDLAFGLTHWAHILREMLICQTGGTFISWLGIHADAADRIPQKNVMKGVGFEPGSKARHDIGPALPVHVFMYISPVVISGSAKPEDAPKNLGAMLANLGIDNPASPGLKGMLDLKNLSLTIAQSHLDKYLGTFPEISKLPFEQYKASLDASTWNDRIQAFAFVSDVEKVLSVLAAFGVYTNKEKASSSGWQNAAELKEKIEAPVKVAEYLNERAQQLIKAGYGGDMAEIAEAYEKQGRAAIVELSADELETVASYRSFQAFKVMRFGSKLLAGPIGILMGGFQLATEFGAAREAYAAGDPAAVIAHGIQMAAAALVIAVGLAETGALIGIAGAAAWVGPIGWVIAALVLLGALILWLGGKNDLQKYASHCFLGELYGEGGFDKTNKVWMHTDGWGSLRYKHETTVEDDLRWERQRIALLRLITPFRTWTGLGHLKESGPIWEIKVGYMPAGAYFQLEMTFTSKANSSHSETRKAAVWGDGRKKIEGETREDKSDIALKEYPDGKVFEVNLVPLHLPGEWDWECRVRLCYTPGSSLPATGWVVNKSGNISNTVSSDDADEEEEGEGKEGGE